jgi:hypothetical protein
MTANEWSDQASTLVAQALTATQGRDTAAILKLENSFLQHKRKQVPGVAGAVDTVFRNAMFALNDAIVGDVVDDWATLTSALEAGATALSGLAAGGKQAATLLSLQPVTDIANSLTALVADIKTLKANPASAEAVAQKVQDISDQLQRILATAKLG